MKIEELKPNVIVQGPIFPDPVQVIVAIPVGDSVKLVGKGLNMGWDSYENRTLSKAGASVILQAEMAQ
ncbi:MAG: hypothetical protein KAV83_03565 [Desulfobacterales bacterium]|nr:hypothetical protein [Desulfobacterales bacterium]